jgi:hypothetical protein
MAEMKTKPDLKSDGTEVPDALRKNLEWYIANQKDLAEKYNGKILLIVDQHLINAFPDMGSAYAEASKAYRPGTFTLQPCSPDAESYMVMLYGPAFAIL